MTNLKHSEIFLSKNGIVFNFLTISLGLIKFQISDVGALIPNLREFNMIKNRNSNTN